MFYVLKKGLRPFILFTMLTMLLFVGYSTNCHCPAKTEILSGDVVPVPKKVKPQKIIGATPRNVVFILSDDHRYDAMSFMGHPLAETPHLDDMAKSGVHVKNAFVTTSICSPSRASILTGLYTFRHRVVDNQSPVPEGSLFFPQYLQKAGYNTAFIGKWHMGATQRRSADRF